MKKILILLASIVLAACGGLPQQQKPLPQGQGFTTDVIRQTLGVPSGETSHVKCRETGQEGCFGFRVPVYAKTGHSAFAPIDGTLKKPNDMNQATWDRFVEGLKVQDMPPALWSAYMRGEIPAGGAYTVQYSFYHINKNVGLGNLAAYRVNGMNNVSKAAFTVRTDLPVPIYEKGTPLHSKTPDLVVTVKAEGSNAVATEIQVPWDLIDVQKTHVVICIVDAAGNERMFYPRSSGIAGIKGGHTVPPAHLAWVKEKGYRRGHTPIVVTVNP